MTSRNNSTFTSETHTIFYIRSDYIKGKQEQCRGKFEDFFMDLQQVNYIDKIYLGLSTFPTILFDDQDLHICLSASWLNDNVINKCLREETRKKDIAIVSTRFFVDVKPENICLRFKGF